MTPIIISNKMYIIISLELLPLSREPDYIIMYFATLKINVCKRYYFISDLIYENIFVNEMYNTLILTRQTVIMLHIFTTTGLSNIYYAQVSIL